VAAPTWTTAAVPVGPVRVQVRAHGRSVPGRVVPRSGDRAGAVCLELEEPVHGLALGQAAVVYDAADERCLGGGRVTAADRPAGLPIAVRT
jgi:tRNA-uridine 2-sulfurtransferase